MKIWLYIASLILASTAVANTQSADVSRIAVVSVSSVFQGLPQRASIAEKLDKEFRSRAIDLQNQEQDLQEKIEIFQRDSSIMSQKERKKMEEEIKSQQEIFSSNAQSFENDSQRRQIEERDKLLNQVRVAVGRVASHEGYNIVIDKNAVVYSTHAKDITRDVLDQVK